jgi:hypothetical protein
MLGGAMAAAMPRNVRSRGTTAAFVLGSVFPDIDIVLVPKWFDLYFLYVHPAVTHAVTWSGVEAIVFAAALKRLVRGSRFRPLFLAGWAAIAGHIFSDFADGSDIVLFAPLSRVQYGWHLFGMGEPFVLALLTAACLAAWLWPVRAPIVAYCAFAALAVILSVKAVSGQRALARYRASAPVAQAGAELVPVRNALFEWEIYDQAAGDVRRWRVDVKSGTCDLVFERRNATGPLVAASAELPLVRELLSLTKTWSVQIERQGPDDAVLWSDARMCGNRQCDVSFGGLFSSAGLLRSQIIRIGEFQQVRPIR